MGSREEEEEIKWEAEKEDSKDSKEKDQEARGIQTEKAKGGSCQTGCSRDTATYVESKGTHKDSARLWDWDSKGNVNTVD